RSAWPPAVPSPPSPHDRTAESHIESPRATTSTTVQAAGASPSRSGQGGAAQTAPLNRARLHPALQAVPTRDSRLDAEFTDDPAPGDEL
ncbi:hypothetical protein KDK95_16295, partial [Actinospica sp. MGRD01-02]